MNIKMKDTVPTLNNNIFVRPKKVCLFWEMCLFWENVLIIGALIMSEDNIAILQIIVNIWCPKIF